jgi:hypothetical protein
MKQLSFPETKTVLLKAIFLEKTQFAEAIHRSLVTVVQFVGMAAHSGNAFDHTVLW